MCPGSAYDEINENCSMMRFAGAEISSCVFLSSSTEAAVAADILHSLTGRGTLFCCTNNLISSTGNSMFRGNKSQGPMEGSHLYTEAQSKLRIIAHMLREKKAVSIYSLV